MNIGRRFKAFRKKVNMTQQEAAELIGVKSYQLANYESNRSEPSIKVLINMAKTYRTSIDMLVGNIKPLEHGNINQINEQESDPEEFIKKLKALLKDYEDSYSR